MMLPDKVYDILKWVCLLLLPATAWLYSSLGDIWGLPYVEEIPETINAIAFFIGCIIGVSTFNYNEKKKNLEG